MIGNWKDNLLLHAKEWGLPEHGEWRYMLYNNYHPQCSDVDVFWFHGEAQFPGVVCKIMRESERASREFRHLTEVHSVAPANVPRPLGLEQGNEFSTVWMQGLAGRRLDDNYTATDWRSMAETVAGIHRGLRRVDGSRGAERYRLMVTEPLAALASFGNSALGAFCRDLSSRVTVEWLTALPLIPQHGDLYVGNILRDGSRYYIVDWESFGQVDLPMYDLCTLLLSILRGNGRTSALWKPDQARYVPELIRRYLAILELRQEDARLLLPLALANWFFVQWQDRRIDFCTGLCGVIEDYHGHVSSWERVFLGA